MMKAFRVLIAFAAVLAVVQPSYGIVINFDDLALNNWDPIPDGYGSTSTIAVSYRTLYQPDPDPGVYSNRLLFWNNDYDNLQKVAFSELSSGIAEITFTAIGDADLVRLNSFQMGGWPHTNLTANLLQLENGSGVVLEDWAPILISGSGASSFFPDIAAPELVLLWGYNYNIGIDNIDITSETGLPPGPGVPEPCTMLLVGAGLVGVARLRRKVNG